MDQALQALHDAPNTMVMGVLNNGMSILGIGSDVQQIVKGLVLLFAVAFDVLSKKKSG